MELSFIERRERQARREGKRENKKNSSLLASTESTAGLVMPSTYQIGCPSPSKP